MAIFVDKDGNVVTYENEPEEARELFPNIQEGVQDVLIDGTSIVDENGDADIPMASTQKPGVVMIGAGLGLNANKRLTISPASLADIKTGTLTSVGPIIPSRQNASSFYGLASAAGDTTQAQSDNAVGNYTDAAKIAIQKMLGIYEAPWELIAEETFTNETEANKTITTDSNGQPFELTDVVLLFETPQQETASAKGNYGSLTLNDGTDNIGVVYCGVWTQAANGDATGCALFAENKNGLFVVSGKGKSTSTNMGNLMMNYVVGLGNQYGQYSGVKFGTFITRKVIIPAVTGSGHYILYGRRKWT